MPNVRELLAVGAERLHGEGVPEARLEAEVLLAHVLSIERSSLLLRGEDPVSDSVLSAYHRAVEKRATRFPLQYITGVREFYSLEFEVDESVLIPRPESELIVDEVLRLSCDGRGASNQGEGKGGDRAAASRELGAPQADVGSAERVEGGHVRPGGPVKGGAGGPRVVDVGTGSGCLAVAIAVNLPSSEILATDISKEALEVARRNAARHGAQRTVRFLEGDGLAPALAAGWEGRADFVISNPPYIAEADLDGLQPELRYEPRLALTPGPDGLELTRRLLADAARVLEPGGWVLVELSAGRAEEARRILDPSLWENVDVKPDLQQIPRLLVARRR